MAARAGKRWGWKAYFYLLLVLTIGAATFTFLGDLHGETPWWEWGFVPLYVLQLAGLFGFAYGRAVAEARLWRVIFIASVAYEAWNLATTAMDPEVAAHPELLGMAALLSFGLQLPLLVALYLYGFRSEALWRRKPLEPAAASD